jgi:hypothetical protein
MLSTPSLCQHDQTKIHLRPFASLDLSQCQMASMFPHRADCLVAARWSFQNVLRCPMASISSHHAGYQIAARWSFQNVLRCPMASISSHHADRQTAAGLSVESVQCVQMAQSVQGAQSAKVVVCDPAVLLSYALFLYSPPTPKY